MSKPFDAVAKTLIEMNPKDWVDYLGVKAEHVEVVDADIATVTANADKVIRVKSRKPWLINVEFLSWSDPDIATSCLDYSVLLTRKHKMLVHTVLVLLHRGANRRDITGLLERNLNGKRYLVFEYDIIRVWETPVESILTGKLATLALAPLADFPASQLVSVLKRMEDRIEREATLKQAEELRTDAYIFAGLRFSAKILEGIVRGAAKQMKNSSTYQLILNEGREEGREDATRDLLLRFAARRLGSPKLEVQAMLETITDVKVLEYLFDSLESVETWDDLLAKV